MSNDHESSNDARDLAPLLSQVVHKNACDMLGRQVAVGVILIDPTSQTQGIWCVDIVPSQLVKLARMIINDMDGADDDAGIIERRGNEALTHTEADETNKNPRP